MAIWLTPLFYYIIKLIVYFYAMKINMNRLS